MNASQIHLALTHVPVILSFVGLVLLIVSFVKKNDTTTRIAFFLLLFAGLFTIPVFLTGEGSEEIVEHLPGTSESLIERHEDVAKLTLFIISSCGIIAFAGLLLYSHLRLGKAIKFMALLFAFASAGAMAQTAHLGGQIRHSEIRAGFAATANDGGGGEAQDHNDDDL